MSDQPVESFEPVPEKGEELIKVALTKEYLQERKKMFQQEQEQAFEKQAYLEQQLFFAKNNIERITGALMLLDELLNIK